MEEQAKRIDISGVKATFVRNFPSHPLSKILLSEPDSVTGEELLAKAQTWLAFFHGEEKNE